MSLSGEECKKCKILRPSPLRPSLLSRGGAILSHWVALGGSAWLQCRSQGRENLRTICMTSYLEVFLLGLFVMSIC
jgi:hypothetical protein